MIYVKVNSYKRIIRCNTTLTLSFYTVFSAILLSQPGFAQPFQHKFGELREYHKHWLAVCPNTYEPNSNSDYTTSCWAVTHAGGKGFFLSSRLTVLRNRQSGAIKITFLFDDYAKIDKGKQVNVRFSNGTKMDFAFGTSVLPRHSINEFVIAAENPDEMLQIMKASNWMQLKVPTTDGVQSINYSMIGLTAAMKFTKDYAEPKTN